MSDYHKRIFLLILVMAIVSLAAVGSTAVLLLQLEIEAERERLVITVQSHARLIESVARFDEKYSADYPGGAAEATLSQVIAAQDLYKGFGETGELALARLEGNRIVFLFRQHKHGLEIPPPVPFGFGSNLAEPMRQALLGNSGSLIGRDYRGDTVIAAFEPVAVLNFGLVAKIDLAEILSPFIHTGIIIGLITIAIILAGGMLFLRITSPMIDELQESEEKLRSITASAHDAIVMIDHEGAISFWNEAAERMFGYRYDEVKGSALHKLIVPDRYYQSFAKNFGNFRATGQGAVIGATIELDAVRKDGGEFPIELSVAAVTIAKQWHAVGIVRDITERKQNEQALRESEERYRNLVDSSIQGLLVHRDFKPLFANQAYARIFGFASPEEVIAMGTLVPLIDPEEREKIEAIKNARMKGDAVPIEYEFAGRRKDGSSIWLYSANRMIDWMGEPAIQGTFIDITERKLLRDQLNMAQRMEAIGRLAGGVAHDFNNLLAVILSYSGFLMEEFKEGDPAREDVKEIQDAAERAASLTRQLLAFSRRQTLQLEILDLNETIENMDKMLRRLIGEDIDLVTIPANELGRVRADASQIEQIVMNLAVNARDAMPRGGKLTIETANAELDDEYVATHAGSRPGAYVMLGVTDTGIGMDEETRSRIFDPFFTTKEKGKGTGLGLATVYGIVKQFEGNIWVYSEPGQGTSLKIYLPRTDEGADEQDRQSSASDILTGTETILLAEDDDAVRKAARRILEQAGYTIIEARNGPEALRLFAQYSGPIHLMLTDVVMPQMSGRELAERLASKQPQIRVLYMSGYTDNAIAHHGILEEDVRLLQKPFTQETMLKNVREVLDAR